MQISLFGYGKTTRAIAENLCEKFGKFAIFDDKFKEKSEDKFGNLLLNPREFDPQKSQLEIPSPGFPRDHTLIKKARNLQSEYDFFYDAMPKSVWISGTNGKTTTTQMTQFLLADFGAQMGANVGVPLAELDANARLWILETSSFTLHYTRLAKPEIYALLPISDDHISWHGNFKAYESAKLSVLARMNEGDVAILPQIYAKTPSKALILGYEDEVDLAEKFGINLSEIKFKTPFLLDALMALSIEKILLDRTNYDKINAFKIEENKLEEFYDKFNRLWVNDTKATNIDAVRAALKRYADKKIHLILGGDSKGVSLKPLFADFAGLDIEIYAIGSCEEEILNLAKSHKIMAYKCEILENAVNLISKNFKKSANLKSEISAENLNSLNLDTKISARNLPNLKNEISKDFEKKSLNLNSENLNLNSENVKEIALLSPACASLDQFASYAQRGEKFKEFVRNL